MVYIIHGCMVFASVNAAIFTVSDAYYEGRILVSVVFRVAEEEVDQLLVIVRP
jgi:hypothetical protein